MTDLNLLRRNSLLNTRIADSYAKPSALTGTDLHSTSSLYVNSGSLDSNLPDYDGSIADLAHELYGELSTLNSPTASGLFMFSPQNPSRESTFPKDPSARARKDASLRNEGVGSPSDDSVDLIHALEGVAKQVCKLPVPRPPSMSPLEWCHALDSPDDNFPPWDDIYDLDENTMTLKTQEHTSPRTHDFAEESGYASGYSSPYLFTDLHRDPIVRNPKHLQIITDARLTPTLPSITHSPHSPRDIPLPQTPVDSDFMPASPYDTSSGNQSSRSKLRTGGFKDIILRQRRSVSPSPILPTFALNDQTEKDLGIMTKKSELRRLKSLIFREAAEDMGSEVLSFLDI
ncbi:hypothetical protein BDY19DRAFT_936507 [Irpex rosettiformis]|uniref:Uncharacterized protein n=1 Tax=Irpex rosettiformis TaxID=378272 RepID=A0ACB8U8T1_9APHY|nr:hypothetical protein BDY19DRAFT_936507 [Irpex rosettiformis]